MVICGYAQTDAVATWESAVHRRLRRRLRARVDTPRHHRGAGDGEAHRVPRPHTGLDTGEPGRTRLGDGRDRSRRLRTRCQAGAMRARTVPGHARGHLAA